MPSRPDGTLTEELVDLNVTNEDRVSKMGLSKSRKEA